MLLEVFDENNYKEAIRNPGEPERRLPNTVISETPDDWRNGYLKVRDFLINTLDRPEYQLKTVGGYVLQIDREDRYATEYTASISATRSNVKKYTFKFEYTGKNRDMASYPIAGTVSVDGDGQIISFTRNSREGAMTTVTNGTVTIPRMMYDPTSSSGERVVYDNISAPGSGYGYTYPGTQITQLSQDTAIGVSPDPFVPSDQPSGGIDTKDQSVDRNDDTPPVELSPNSFQIDGTTIETLNPELEIGKVEDHSFKIDADKQAIQDAFLKTLSGKISRARPPRK